MNEFVEFAKAFGLPMGLVVLMLLWGKKVFDRIQTEKSELTDYIQDTLEKKLDQAMATMDRVSDALEKLPK